MTMKQTSPDTWERRGGQVIKISEMTDAHLVNTLRLCHQHLIKAAASRRIHYLFSALTNSRGKIFDRLLLNITWEQPTEQHTKLKFPQLRSEAQKRLLNWKYSDAEVAELNRLFELYFGTKFSLTQKAEDEQKLHEEALADLEGSPGVNGSDDGH